MDSDGLYPIIANGAANPDYEGHIHFDGESNVVQFSFKTFNTGREKIFVHVQTLLQLATGTRRRLLSNDVDGTDQIRHFVEGTSVGIGEGAPLNAEESAASALYDNCMTFFTLFSILRILFL